MPSVGINGLLLESPLSGTATYTRNLVPLLKQVDPGLTCTLYVRKAQLPGSDVEHVRLSTPLDGVRGTTGLRAAKLLWEEAVLPAASAIRGDHLLHYLYFAAPAVARAPVVVTVHDLIPLVMEGYHRSRQSSLYARLMASTVRRADAIMTVSWYSKEEIVRVLGVPDHRVHVTYEAADERFQPKGVAGERERLATRYGLPLRFVLYLGGAERRKNIETLVRAWRRIAARMESQDMALVVVARFPRADSLYPDIPRLARELGLSTVHFIDSVAEDDKPALYRAATAFAFPTRYEGFGLPLIEAMACGTPVLASSATSIPEVMGSAGVLLPPGDVDAWSDALEEVVRSGSVRSELAAKGLVRARQFSWRRTAEETAAIYREVLSR